MSAWELPRRSCRSFDIDRAAAVCLIQMRRAARAGDSSRVASMAATEQRSVGPPRPCRWQTWPPGHIGHLHDRVQRSTPDGCLLATGAPTPGTVVLAASMPGRCARPAGTRRCRGQPSGHRRLGVGEHVVPACGVPRPRGTRAARLKLGRIAAACRGPPSHGQAVYQHPDEGLGVVWQGRAPASRRQKPWIVIVRPHLTGSNLPSAPDFLSHPRRHAAGDITLQNFGTPISSGLDAAAGAAGHLGALVRPLPPLGPILRGGRRRPMAAVSKLAKLNSDEQPRDRRPARRAFGVRSIPFCVRCSTGPAHRAASSVLPSPRCGVPRPPVPLRADHGSRRAIAGSQVAQADKRPMRRWPGCSRRGH